MEPSQDGFEKAREPEAAAPADEAGASQDTLFVLQRLQEGTQPAEVIQELVGRGMGRGQAGYLVENLHAELERLVERQRLHPPQLLLAALGGLLAAGLGGAAWAALTVATSSEFGFGALGIGLLGGFAVMLFAGMRRGRPLQILAVLSAVLGILLGKYGTVYWLVKESLEKAHGPEAVRELSPFSLDFASSFFAHASEWASGFDLLWIGLAIMAAWGIPRAKLVLKKPAGLPG
jgi:hypothetical protein